MAKYQLSVVGRKGTELVTKINGDPDNLKPIVSWLHKTDKIYKASGHLIGIKRCLDLYTEAKVKEMQALIKSNGGALYLGTWIFSNGIVESYWVHEVRNA